MRKSLFIGLLALSSTMIFAQNQEQRIKEPEKITFKPHWFIQAQIGAAHTIGEAKFTDLVSLQNSEQRKYSSSSVQLPLPFQVVLFLLQA